MAKREEIPTTDSRQIEQLIERLQQGKLEQRDTQLLERLLRTFLSLLSVLQQKNASIKKLKRMIFGPRSEKRKASSPQTGGPSVPTSPGQAEMAPDQSSTTESRESSTSPPSNQKPKKPGHGRKKAADYTGAKVLRLHHTSLQSGDQCPLGCGGRLHELKQPQTTIYLTGQPVVGATRYEQQVLRCSGCQEYFRAELPAEAQAGKYSPSADVAIALMKYGGGMPFYRLARLQAACGVPLPPSVQFERCEVVANAALPVYLHLLRLGADGEVFHTDDTRVVILACLKEDQEAGGEQNRATQTSGIVVKIELRKIAFYFSARRHAGENLAELLKRRSAGLETPIQMADALSANFSGGGETIAAKCLVHGRRKLIEIEENFPSECAQVLAAIREVYRIEDETKGMSAAERLAHHQQYSGPVMRELREWIDEQFGKRKVEPNSGLGQALRYLLKHWEGLTRFLTVPGAPIDNNEVERVLKQFVLFRKNSLFYKTEHGAAVGDILMSLIETCRLNGVNAWEYLLTLVRERAAARQNPAAYLPWNYVRGAPAGEEVAAAARAA
jgi:hypothetical protein